ncbi:hypothetical protein PTKIN_Ptkin16aG0013700 [Pterospermum kingtungense]
MIEVANIIIIEEITKKLDIEKLLLATSEPLRIADLGCSYGPNTILAIQNIVEAIECKFQSHGLISPEFQVFFNDQNQGRIHYIGAPKEVIEAYAGQFAKDMDSFFNARVKEFAPRGLMALVIASAPDVASHPDVKVGLQFEILGSCLMDMAKMVIFKAVEFNEFSNGF